MPVNFSSITSTVTAGVGAAIKDMLGDSNSSPSPAAENTPPQQTVPQQALSSPSGGAMAAKLRREASALKANEPEIKQLETDSKAEEKKLEGQKSEPGDVNTQPEEMKHLDKTDVLEDIMNQLASPSGGGRPPVNLDGDDPGHGDDPDPDDLSGANINENRMKDALGFQSSQADIESQNYEKALANQVVKSAVGQASRMSQNIDKLLQM